MKKPDEKLITEFEALAIQAKAIEERRKQLIHEFKTYGPFSTPNFVVSVADRTRDAMVGMEAATGILGASKEKLRKMGLITTQKFKVVQVSRKGA